MNATTEPTAWIGGSGSGAVAAIDIGTNSTRLCVVHPGEPGGRGPRELERTTTITRLGAGVDANRRLDPEAMARTCAALADYRGRCERHGVGQMQIIATSAARDAANREEFFDLAEAALGQRPALVSGEQEAALAFAGAASAVGDSSGLVLVIDIGGGSTEFILGSPGGPGRDPVVHGSISIDVGSVRLTEREFHHDPPRPEELSNAIALVQAHLEDVEQAIPAVFDAAHLIGVAGTITTVAAVEIGLVTYDPSIIHGYELTRPAAEEVFRTLATEKLADRLFNPGLPAARADVIVGGCCILVAIMRWLRADRLMVSEHDLLDGMISSMTRKG